MVGDQVLWLQHAAHHQLSSEACTQIETRRAGMRITRRFESSSMPIACFVFHPQPLPISTRSSFHPLISSSSTHPSSSIFCVLITSRHSLTHTTGQSPRNSTTLWVWSVHQSPMPLTHSTLIFPAPKLHGLPNFTVAWQHAPINIQVF